MASAASLSSIRLVLSNLNRNSHFDGFDDVGLFRLMDPAVAVKAAELIPKTAGQLRQDILAAVVCEFKRDGYFVEIGATDGFYLSNTLLLEREFGWRGILAEPAKYWHEALHKNRSTIIDTRCVHAESGKTLMFSEVPADQALSTISEYIEGDLHSATRRTNTEYQVESISLKDLLDANSAPHEIDLLSIDTEGSEFDILQDFDFDTYQFKLICCEHNYTPHRTSILELLRRHGYIRILDGISQFDDWYVHESMKTQLERVLPDWSSVSTQEDSQSTAPLSDKDRMIRTLQITVENLIVERDAYKEVLEVQTKVEMLAKDDAIRTLQETVENLIIDRDTYRDAYVALRGE